MSRPKDEVRVVRTPRGARLVQGGLVLSEIVASPGPTHSLFDVLAACVSALAPGPQVALLGFAGGGIVAPLRAMGFGHPLEAVDLSLEGERVFRSLSGPWSGRVEVERDDAVRWLRRRRRAWDLILEDLSAHTAGGVTKPSVSLDVLPALLHARTAARGLAVVNVLPVPGLPWANVLARIAAPWPEARVVFPDEYENRVLVLGRRLPTARSITHALRRTLAAVGSDQAPTVTTRTLAQR